MNKLFLASAVVVASVAVVPAVQATEQTTFTDVPANHPFYKEITNLASQGILEGYGDGLFLPAKEVTRAEAAKIIAEALQLDTENVNNPNFGDVSTDAWYYPYVAVLADKGIIQGFEGKYSPNAPLKRADMAIILTKAYELELAKELTHPFTDVNQNDYYSFYVQTLLNYEITNGASATTYSPDSYVKREQLAAFVTRAQALDKPSVPSDPKPEQPVEPTPEQPVVPTPEPEQPPVTPTDPNDGTTQPEPPTPAEPVSTILQKHQATYASLEASANARVDALVNAALADYRAGLDFGGVLDKYGPLAASLEASVDASFNAFYATVVTELQANGHDASEAELFRAAYNAAKEARKNSILSEL